MTKIPSKIKIGPYLYQIKRAGRIQYEEDDCYGLCDQQNKIIWLNTELKGAKLAEYFFHEVTHAFEDVYKVKFTEKEVGVLGMAIAALLLDNKIEVFRKESKPRRKKV